MNKRYKLWIGAWAVSVSLLFAGCGTKEKTEKDAAAVTAETESDSNKKKETVVQPKKDSKNTVEDKKVENSDINKPADMTGQGADTNAAAEENVQEDNAEAVEESRNPNPDINAYVTEEETEKDLIESCGYVIATNEGPTMLIAEGWEEAPPSVIEARETGVSYYIGDAEIDCPCRISAGLVVYFTYYTEDGVNIAVDITSDGDEKEPRFYDYEYEYPQDEQ